MTTPMKLRIGTPIFFPIGVPVIGNGIWLGCSFHSNPFLRIKLDLRSYESLKERDLALSSAELSIKSTFRKFRYFLFYPVYVLYSIISKSIPKIRPCSKNIS